MFATSIYNSEKQNPPKKPPESNPSLTILISLSSYFDAISIRFQFPLSLSFLFHAIVIRFSDWNAVRYGVIFFFFSCEGKQQITGRNETRSIFFHSLGEEKGHRRLENVVEFNQIRVRG